MKIIKQGKHKIKCIRDEESGIEITPQDLSLSNNYSDTNIKILEKALKAELKPEVKVGLFDLLNDLNYSKTNLIEGNEDVYVPYIINKMLGQHKDAIFAALEMDMRSNLSNEVQFKFLSSILRARKRYGKKAKKENNIDIDAVAKIEKLSFRKAKDLLDIVLLEIDELPEDYLEALEHL